MVEEAARLSPQEEGLVRLDRRNQWGVIYSVAVVSSSTLISGFIKRLLKQCAVPAMPNILAKESVQRAVHMFLFPNPKGVQPC